MRGSRPIPSRDLADVGADLLADVGDLVDERDLGGEEGVRSELDHLRGGDVGADDRAAERLIELRRPGPRPQADCGSDSRSRSRSGRRKSSTADPSLRNSGLEMYESSVFPSSRKLPVDRRPGADRNGALHDERVIGRGRQLLDHGVDAREVGIARNTLAVHRCSRTAGERGRAQGRARSRSEDAPSSWPPARTGLARRSANVSRPQIGDRPRIDVTAPHVVAQPAKQAALNQAHPSDADDAYWEFCRWLMWSDYRHAAGRPEPSACAGAASGRYNPPPPGEVLKKGVGNPVRAPPRLPAHQPQPVAVVEEQRFAAGDLAGLGGLLEYRRIRQRSPCTPNSP